MRGNTILRLAYKRTRASLVHKLAKDGTLDDDVMLEGARKSVVHDKLLDKRSTTASAVYPHTERDTHT